MPESIEDLKKQRQEIERKIEHCAEGLKEAKAPMGKKSWQQNIETLTKNLKQLDEKMAFLTETKSQERVF